MLSPEEVAVPEADAVSVSVSVVDFHPSLSSKASASFRALAGGVALALSEEVAVPEADVDSDDDAFPASFSSAALATC